MPRNKITASISDDLRAKGWEELRLALREGPDLAQAYARMLDVMLPLIHADALEEAADGLCCGYELEQRAARLRGEGL